jgi:hypothetical protein
MSSDAHSDAVKHLAASIRRYATVAAIKRQALAAASLACDKSDKVRRPFAHAHSTTQELISKPRPRLRPLFAIANDDAARTLLRCLIRRKI